MLLQRMILAALLSLPLALAAPGLARAQVGTWLLQGKVRATVQAQGKVRRETHHFQGVMTINEDGSYSQPGTVLCGGDYFYTAEVGTWRPTGGKRFLLEPGNLDELLGLVKRCFLGSLRVSVSATKYQHEVRVLKRGKRIQVKTVFNGHVNVAGRSFPFKAVGQFNGKPTTQDVFPLTARQVSIPALVADVWQRLEMK